MQILGIVMGTNLAPIFTNIYTAMLEEKLCKKKNRIRPKMLNIFIADSFGVIKSNKKISFAMG